MFSREHSFESATYKHGCDVLAAERIDIAVIMKFIEFHAEALPDGQCHLGQQRRLSASKSPVQSTSKPIVA